MPLWLRPILTRGSLVTAHVARRSSVSRVSDVTRHSTSVEARGIDPDRGSGPGGVAAD